MKTNEIFLEMGNKLELKYKMFGFKYSKSYQWVLKRTKEYEYIISFSSFSGNTKEKIALSVHIFINYRKLNEQLFYISLWNYRYFYNIGEDYTFDQVYDNLQIHIENLLIPFINKFENNVSKYEHEWIDEGFLGKINGTLYKKPLWHKDWIDENYIQEHNIFGYETNLAYMNEKFGKETAEKCLNNYYKSLNKETKEYFKKAYENEKNDIVNEFSVVEKYIDVGKIKEAIKLGIELN
jgi:hypothetical protein